jgi:formate dehydrogenase subunit delta
MNNSNLIFMANKIGVFFESMPDRKEALEGIAKHLKSFWEPRMRKAFLAEVDGEHSQEISPIVLAAVREHRDLLGQSIIKTH